MAEPLPLTTTRRPGIARTWAGRLAGIVFGLLLAWLLVELLIRLLFFSLPPRLQLVLQHVHKTPFSDARLLPDPIWQPDIDYLTITRPAHNRVQFGSAEVRFTVSTESLWGARLAFRTRQELVDRHVDGVAVGDSFTFCFTDEEDCWVQRLAQITGRNIINLGITSTGSLSHARVLTNFGLPLRPPLVIWQWFGNDANEDYGLAALRGETAVQSTNPAPLPPKRTWWDDHSALYVLLKLYLGQEDEFDATLQFHAPLYAEQGDVRLAFGEPYLLSAFDMTQPHNLDGWERGTAAIRAARAAVEEYDGRLVMLLMPTKEQVYRHLSEPLLGAEKLAVLDAPYQMMRDFCAAEGLTCLDPLLELQAHAQAGEQLYYTTDMHLNARGNEVLAQWLAAWMGE